MLDLQHEVITNCHESKATLGLRDHNIRNYAGPHSTKSAELPEDQASGTPLDLLRSASRMSSSWRATGAVSEVKRVGTSTTTTMSTQAGSEVVIPPGDSYFQRKLYQWYLLDAHNYAESHRILWDPTQSLTAGTFHALSNRVTVMPKSAGAASMSTQNTPPARTSNGI